MPEIGSKAPGFSLQGLWRYPMIGDVQDASGRKRSLRRYKICRGAVLIPAIWGLSRWIDATAPFFGKRLPR